MAVYTQDEKEKLIRRFELQCTQRREDLMKEMKRLANMFESKVQRRIATVPKKFTDLRIKDVLTVERDHKIKIYELLKDVEKLNQQKKKHNGLTEEEVKEELLNLKKKRAEGVQFLRKRKESMQGRVTKPKKR